MNEDKENDPLKAEEPFPGYRDMFPEPLRAVRCPVCEKLLTNIEIEVREGHPVLVLKCHGETAVFMPEEFKQPNVLDYVEKQLSRIWRKKSNTELQAEGAMYGQRARRLALARAGFVPVGDGALSDEYAMERKPPTAPRFIDYVQRTTGGNREESIKCAEVLVKQFKDNFPDITFWLKRAMHAECSTPNILNIRRPPREKVPMPRFTGVFKVRPWRIIHHGTNHGKSTAILGSLTGRTPSRGITMMEFDSSAARTGRMRSDRPNVSNPPRSEPTELPRDTRDPEEQRMDAQDTLQELKDAQGRDEEDDIRESD